MIVSLIKGIEPKTCEDFRLRNSASPRRPFRRRAPGLRTSQDFGFGERTKGLLVHRTFVIQTQAMTQNEFKTLKPDARAKWLNEVSPTNSWAFKDDVFCHHCDGLFKAEDVACDKDGDPTCPLCYASTPLDFHKLPWWREDLCNEPDGDEGYTWKVEPLHAISGQPRRISR